ESKDVRIQLDEASAPWFNANDVCSILEFGNPRQAIESHADVEDVQKLDAIDNLGRTRQTNHINESGLYSLIMGSTKPAAKRFKRWVTSEVLPTLRKTGTYSTPGALPTLPGPT
ncbi:BRO-N domain-containing protein, partial [Xylella fastidiosa]